MTTTAVALFGSRVSPRFDCTLDFMLVTSSESTINEQHTEAIRDHMPMMKVRRLADLNVDTLICGGIDESSREELRVRGIKVLADLKGEAEDAVSSYIGTPKT
ncbi:MAG: NifB/NifX family molybdenum-iron cluster-binding protein [Desulfobulbaceae bacterium]|nr:NifB/NifX family molybdenum-iron cluster-binding protein [Desulfobulbaceae bacterium]